MRAYLIDEISPSDMEKINGFLKKNAVPSSLNQIFWVRIPGDLLSSSQFEHSGCQPHVFAVELGSNWVKLEFLVRSLKNMHCTCQGYCTQSQQEYIINFTHGMLERLVIRT